VSLAREKLAQAQNLLSAGDLWLIFGEESLEPPEPALELLTEASFTWATFLLITREEAQAIVGRYDAPSLPAFWSVEAYDEDFTPILTRALEELAPRRILLDYGTEPLLDALGHGAYLRLRSLLRGFRQGSAERLLFALRSHKSFEEQTRLTRAIREAEADLKVLEEALEASWSELEAQAFLHRRLRERGLEPAWGWSGCSLLHFGRAPSHAPPSPTPLRPRSLLHIDYGVRYQGYCSDLQRSFWSGGAIPEHVQRAFQAVRAALDAAASALRPGTPGYEVDRAARQKLLEWGYPEHRFATGHPLGRATHDVGPLLGPLWPRYRDRPRQRVQEGEIYAIELGVLLEEGYIGLEEDLRVGLKGAEWISERQETLRALDL